MHEGRRSWRSKSVCRGVCMRVSHKICLGVVRSARSQPYPMAKPPALDHGPLWEAKVCSKHLLGSALRSWAATGQAFCNRHREKEGKGKSSVCAVLYRVDSAAACMLRCQLSKGIYTCLFSFVKSISNQFITPQAASFARAGHRVQMLVAASLHPSRYLAT